MKIAIPVGEKSLKTSVFNSFGRAPYFLVYDRDTKTSTYIENSAASAQGGAGIKAAQLVVDSGVTAALVPRCGKNAAEVLSGGRVKLYEVKAGTVEKNIDRFLAGELTELKNIHPGHHNRGGS